MHECIHTVNKLSAGSVQALGSQGANTVSTNITFQEIGEHVWVWVTHMSKQGHTNCKKYLYGYSVVFIDDRDANISDTLVEIIKLDF